MTVIDRRYSVAEGQAYKAPCRVATTANITLSDLQAIDGVTVEADDRVLVKDQTTASENGIYLVSTGNWTRTRDFDGAYDVVTGTAVYITDGIASSVRVYVISTTGDITVGTTPINFSVTARADLFLFIEGGWITATEYDHHNVLSHLGSSYIALFDHTSSAASEPGVGGSWETFWEILALEGTISIADSSITYAKIQDVSDTDKLLGRVSPGAGVVEEISCTATGRSLIDDASIADMRTTLGLDDPWLFQPIGSPIPIWTNLSGADAPPTDQSYRYVLLTAGESGFGEYNEGVVTAETISGSSPDVVASFKINLVASPMHDATIHCINTEGRFLRPNNSSGATQESANLAHAHSETGLGNLGVSIGVDDGVEFAGASNTGSSGGNEARPRNIGAPYYMRIL